MINIRLSRLRGLFLAACAGCLLTAGSQTVGRSLDDVDRESFGATMCPVTLPGHDMTACKPWKVNKKLFPGTISLSGDWELIEGADMPTASSRSVKATVPGGVHKALFDAGLIPDPTIGMNDSIAEKQSYKDWWYRRTFRYDKHWKQVMLSFGGVANKCTVYLNGKELGRHEGMLGGPDFMLTEGELRHGENVLLVHLEPIPPTTAYANASWVSTVVANCVYGWHYVKIPTLGLWQDVELKEVPSNVVENPFIFTRNTDGSMRLVVDLPQPTAKGSIDLLVTPKNFKGKPQAYSYKLLNTPEGTLALDFTIDNPRLWWPNGHGEHPVYTATITYRSGNGAVDQKSVNFGIRTIEMRPVGGEPKEDTYNWQFVVNGRPLFVKGANWCLPDFFMDLSAERYSRFLGAAKDQNLNFLRAWGGGLVETDTFYDLCDEMGLMVMQEWPTAWDSHLHQNQSVLRETIDRNTDRIRSHPSLVLWAGGNESANPFGEAIDYMGRKSIERDGTRPFHRGEPWGGSNHNHDSWWLDYHLNNALNMGELFFGEFGMPSLPVKETVLRYLDGEEYTYPLGENTVFEHHAPVFGNWEEIRRLYREVGFFVEPTTLDNVILGSQLAQTLGTRRALERTRTMWPDRCAGAAYYKINDVYPGLSWGTVDYYGAKKPVHYFIKRSAAQVMPVIVFNETNLTGRPAAVKYFMLDDTLSTAGERLELTVSVYNHEMKPLLRRADTVSVASPVTPLPDICLDKKQTTTPMLWFKTDARDADGRLIARNWYIENFDSKVNAILEAPKCRIEVVQDGSTVSITNTSDAIPCVGVSIEVPGESTTLDLSDNMLWIDPGETVTVTMSTASPATVTAWNAEP